ncbi:MAG: peptide chain release factor N(5)-glutamine methyltransferase [Lachnospiraceae bacterium]|nr:peptide chain release factor N(5)-glutamine methyltransferase [Lachnospiraceae bacterium]
MTLKDALSYGREQLEAAGILNYELDAWYLLEYVCKIKKSDYYLHNSEEMEEEKFQEYELLLRKRGERVPLQYITGVQEFMGLEFKVNSHVLIPRQDTETLVEEALKVLEPEMEVLDLCTGSGCIMISLLKHAKQKIFGTASDISKQALLIAKENAKQNQVEMELVRSDLFQNITGRFDMILSNPPYIPTNLIETLMPEVKNFEPLEALDGSEDGLSFYRKIVDRGRKFLKSNGYLYFEIGHDQGGRVAFLMEEYGFRNVKVVKDLTGNDRVVCGNLPAVL